MREATLKRHSEEIYLNHRQTLQLARNILYNQICRLSVGAYMLDLLDRGEIMWKHMNEEEIRREKNRSRWVIEEPGGFAVIIFFISAGIIKIGPDKWKADFFPMPWGEFFREGLLKAFLVGLASFFVFYVTQIILKRSVLSGPQVIICLKCGKLKNGKRPSPCDCGGEFIPLDELEWIAEEEVQK